jgi:PTH1 family peptidyl-tRNA hydrolase
MNNSGKVLQGLRPPESGPVPDLLIMSDDFAIPAGTLRLRPGGSAGGHNGLKSIEAVLGTQEYARLRIGVGPVPAGTSNHDYVLTRMDDEGRRLVMELMPTLCEAVETWLAEGTAAAMARYNRKAKTEEP